MKSCLVVLTGASGSGKTAVESGLSEMYGMHRCISLTTRKPREGEVDGVSYNFVSEKEFKSKELLESNCYNDNFYGLGKDGLVDGKPNLLVAEWNGIEQLRKNYKGKLIVINLYASESNRCSRMLERGDSKAEVATRIAVDSRKFKVFDVRADKNIINESTVEECVNCVAVYLKTLGVL